MKDTEFDDLVARVKILEDLQGISGQVIPPEQIAVKQCLCYKSHTTNPISCGCPCHHGTKDDVQPKQFSGYSTEGFKFTPTGIDNNGDPIKHEIHGGVMESNPDSCEHEYKTYEHIVPNQGTYDMCIKCHCIKDAHSDSCEDEEWEYFCDVSYYYLWCVRFKSQKYFGRGFHVTSEKAACSLCILLNSRHKKQELDEKEVALLLANYEGKHHRESDYIKCLAKSICQSFSKPSKQEGRLDREE